jgi:DNA repair protein RadC
VTPSPEDIQVTDTLEKAGKLLGIEVLDHVIVGEDGVFCSLRRDGRMPRE